MAIHAAGCLFTNYFGDDYYYAAFVGNGAKYMLSENISHYLYGNGRALVHLIDQLLLGVSFWFWRAAAVAVMGALVVVSARLAARTYRADYDPEQYKNAMIAVCALLAVTDIAILRQSVYWATGSLNYLFPAVATLWFVWWLRRDFELGRGSWLLLLPAFFASATTEQASAASLLAVLWIIVTAILQKRRLRPAWFGCFALSLAGFLTLMLAPGSAARTQYYPDFYSMRLVDRILSNVKPLTGTVFGPGGMYALIIVVLALVAHRLWRRIPLLSLIPIAAIGLYTYGLTRRRELLSEWWFIVLLLLPLAAVFVKCAVDYFRRGEIDNLYFVWGAVAMQCAMALTPE
ncbi:MAG: hypothetical protein IKC99_03185, partial [Clostridia bacterium]|nr:hypothetical protein [Clostridia bacterium]